MFVFFLNKTICKIQVQFEKGDFVLIFAGAIMVPGRSEKRKKKWFPLNDLC